MGYVYESSVKFPPTSREFPPPRHESYSLKWTHDAVTTLESVGLSRHDGLGMTSVSGLRFADALSAPFCAHHAYFLSSSSVPHIVNAEGLAYPGKTV